MRRKAPQGFELSDSCAIEFFGIVECSSSNAQYHHLDSGGVDIPGGF